MTVYFDNAATTRVRPEAAEAALRVMTEVYGNPSSTHTMGREAKKELDRARDSVARAVGASPDEIFFTSGGTEADNLALRGGAEAMRHKGRHIVISSVEHDAVAKCAEKLETEGWEITRVAPDGAGRITAGAVKEALRPDTVLVSVMLVNNETGAVNPVQEIASAVKSSGCGALVHTDAVQALCKVPFSVKTLGADLVSLSSHKIHGPKGTGALWIKSGVKIKPVLMGGGQEKGMRSGTEGLPGIAAFGEAARLGAAEAEETAKSMRAVREHTVQLLKEKLPECVFIGEGDAPHILSLSLPGCKSEVLMNYLEAEGVFVSKGSACKKGARSHVLAAMGLPGRVIDGAIRVSFSKYSTEAEAEYFAEKLSEAVSRLAWAK
ncbi:MAG: cysteine desulfurase [Oscillospiraceae bacterium]|nr:cysteine desulfurase [Oscillospiraceae bacterium]